MNHGQRPGSVMSSAWFVTVASLAAIAVLVLLLWSPWQRPEFAGQTLRLYCANGMTRPVNDIIHEYQEKYGLIVQPSFGGSGTLLSSIRAAGGAGDLFLSADSSLLHNARKLGLVTEIIPIAVIQPVLIVNHQTQKKLHDMGRPVTSLEALLRDDLAVVLANFEGAAIGRTSKAMLEAAGLWSKLEKRLKETGAKVSTVGTVNEVAQRVAVRNDSVGLVWKAVARQYKDLAIVPLSGSAKFNEHIEIGVLSKSKNPTAALHFARFLTARDQGLQVFADHHFDPVPDADFWEDVPHLYLSSGAMLEPGVRDVVKAFEKREGVKIDTMYAGCGILVSQMESIKRGQKPGHFPDAYIACDISFADKVQEWYEPAATILQNRLVIIVPKGNPKNVKSLADLKRPDLKIGLPHPKNSALGKLIQDLLVEANFAEDVYNSEKNKKLVHTDAAHTLVNEMRAGALDMAVVGRSNAMSTPANVEKYLDVIDIDAAAALATQTFSIARETRHKYLIKRLLEAIMDPHSMDRFQRLGFTKISPGKVRGEW